MNYLVFIGGKKTLKGFRAKPKHFTTWKSPDENRIFSGSLRKYLIREILRYRYGWIRPNATAKESERIVSVVFFSGYFSFGELISNLAGRPNNTRLCTGELQLLSRDLHIAFKWLLAGCLQNSAVLESGHHPSAVVLQTLQTADILHSPDGRYRGPHKAAPTDWEGGREGACSCISTKYRLGWAEFHGKLESGWSWLGL